MKDTPATVNFMTGDLYLNVDVYPTLTHNQKKFILLHEEGHLVNRSKDELAADLYAIRKMHESGIPMQSAITVMTSLFDENDRVHKLRANMVFDEAMRLNDNEKKKPEIMEKILIKEPLIFGIKDNFDPMGPTEAQFLGFGQKARDRRKKRREERRQYKLSKITAKAEGRAKVAEKGGGSAGILKSIGGYLFGGGGNPEMPPITDETNLPVNTTGDEDTKNPKDPKDPKKPLFGEDMTIWIVIGVAVVVITMVLLIKRK